MTMNIRASFLSIAIALVSFNTPALAQSSFTPVQSKSLFVAESQKIADTEKESVDEGDVNRFTNTIVLIKDFYVQQVKDKSLLDDAIRGMVSGLDPHSEYLDQEAYKTLLMATSGEFGGVGIEVTPEFGVLKIDRKSVV